MSNILSSLTINNIVFKNRVIIPPMASATASSKGYVTNKTLDHY